MDWEQARNRKLFNDSMERTPHHLHLRPETPPAVLTAKWTEHEHRYSYGAVLKRAKKYLSCAQLCRDTMLECTGASTMYGWTRCMLIAGGKCWRVVVVQLLAGMTSHGHQKAKVMSRHDTVKHYMICNALIIPTLACLPNTGKTQSVLHWCVSYESDLCIVCADHSQPLFKPTNEQLLDIWLLYDQYVYACELVETAACLTKPVNILLPNVASYALPPVHLTSSALSTKLHVTKLLA